jgi:putative restriction endonuclease
MAIDQEERARKAWIKLVELAKSHEICSYKEVGDFIGTHHRPVRYVLRLIQDYCLYNNLPPITILVVNGSGKPGQGFIAADENNFTDRRNDVFSFNWDNIENPFDLSKDGYSQEKIINNIVNKDEIPEKILHLVAGRGMDQQIFRKVMIKAYSGKCCICGLSVEELLEAAHIKPYSECSINEKISVNNGLLLCANHHKLFDNEIIKINKEYKITIKNVDDSNESNRKFI